MNSPEIGGFNKGEIKWLRNILSSLENPSVSRFLGCSCKYSDSHGFNASKDHLSSS